MAHDEGTGFHSGRQSFNFRATLQITNTANATYVDGSAQHVRTPISQHRPSIVKHPGVFVWQVALARYGIAENASAGNRTRVTSMATMYSTTRPLMLLSIDFNQNHYGNLSQLAGLSRTVDNKMFPESGLSQLHKYYRRRFEKTNKTLRLDWRCPNYMCFET